jgi:hypothetical protein
MKTEKITLGEREYTLGELPLRKAKAYRERLREPFGALVDLFERTPKTEIDSARQVSQLIRSFSDTVLSSVDTVTDLLLEYSEALENDRDYILDNAYGSQVTDAFMAVLGLVFPFFGTERGTKMVTMIGGLTNARTLTN